MEQTNLHEFRDYPNPTEIEPCGNHLLVQMDAVDEKTPGGILKDPKSVIIEENAQTRGRLIACGPYAWAGYDQPEAHPGQRIIIAKYCGILQDFDGRKYRLIKDVEIMATLRETSESDPGDEA